MYHFRLQRTDGTPADPLTLRTAVPTWNPGDTIPLSARRLGEMSAGQSPLGASPYVCDGGSLPLDPRYVVFPHSRQRLYGDVRRSWRFSHRWPIGHLQKHRKCDALTPRV